MDRHEHKPDRPVHLCMHGVVLYVMEDLDVLYRDYSITYIVTHLGHFRTSHKFFWVNPENGLIESFATHGSALNAYNRVYHTQF